MMSDRWKTKFDSERKFASKHGLHSERKFYIQAYKLYRAKKRMGCADSSFDEFIGELICMSTIYHIDELSWNDKKIDNFVRQHSHAPE